jgi:parallel beta-helix repeat protein
VTVQPTAVAPVTLKAVNIGGAAIDIYGTDVTVEGLTVDGSQDADGNLYAGIRVIDGGSATIVDNTVENITAAPAAANIGIQVGDALVGGSARGGTATITDNTVVDYAGAGVLVDGSSSTATVSGNTITGRATANDGISEYGVQVSNGATGMIVSNQVSGNTIDGNVPGGYNPSPTSAGIFFYNDGNTLSEAARNTTFGNDDGILVQQSSGSVSKFIFVLDNNVEQNYGYAGIFVVSSNHTEVLDNTVSNNTTFNGIALNYSTGVLVNSNNITNNVNADGIYDYVGTMNLINLNNSASNGNNGINIDASTGDVLSLNSTTDNAFSGVQVTGGSDNLILLGISSGNTQDGVFLTKTTGNSVIGNYLRSNGEGALILLDAPNTTTFLNET